MQAFPNSRLNGYLVYLLGACILMIFGLYNSYPIICGDSVAYINTAFSQLVPDDRPIFYGLFLRNASLRTSLWLAIFVQSLILSYVLVNFIRCILPGLRSLHMLGLLVCISVGTIVSWYASQIMPDIFTATLFLAIATFLLCARSRWRDAILLSIIYLSILMHLSNYMISTLMTLLIILLSFVSKRWKEYRSKSLVLLWVCAMSWFTLMTNNYRAGNGFVTSKSTHVFLMGKLAESGILKVYLDKTCPTKDYKICAYRDSLPAVAWGFVWDHRSALYRTGGWEANRQEYNAIIRDIVSRPKYWPYLAYKSMEATARQVVQPNIDEGEEREWVKFVKGDFTYESIKRGYQHEVNEFIVAKQNQKQLDLPFFDHLYTIVLVLSSIICLFGIGNQVRDSAKSVYFLLILFLILNAFVTGTFANVLSRLNSRDIWLLPAVNLIFIYKIVWGYFSRSSAGVIEG